MRCTVREATDEMKIHETLSRDPRKAKLANNGQARIAGVADDRGTAELRAELETFVCEGQFADAIERILATFLTNLDHTKQDSAWVSGFFGSGKSHLLKMLAHLWVNTSFEDGSTARGLVAGGLTDEVEARLRELDTQARRTGREPVAAAGTLLGGSVDQVRQSVLSILLGGTGWPTQYPQAMFCFWLRERGWLDRVRSAVEKAGRPWLRELNDLYVSPPIARALIEADPHFAPDEKAARQVLLQQFPHLTGDITTTQFVEAAHKALSEDGPLPLTILVLDEVQQFINEASDRAATITELGEVLQTQFDSRLLLVAAGQSALSAGTPVLRWLRDRFRVSVQLTDADVESVTRTVLLRKKPSIEPAIEEVLERSAGEIARQLRGTRVGERPEDRRDRVGDYPLLPTRRRFWEACFRAADREGSHSQLRSQLRILFDSLHEIAERELGAVIPASDLFHALAPNLVSSGVLLNEIHTRIQELDDGTEEGRLRRDLSGLVFLIGKMPREEGVDSGIRATAGTLADLLVDDVTADSGVLRNRVGRMLEVLAGDGTLMRVREEYRLQTTEGAEWDRLYREKQTSLRQSEIEITARREQLLAAQVQQVVGEVRLSHGQAKVRRAMSLHTGVEAPKAGGDHVFVWLRDGWSQSEKEVANEARRLGQDDPTLHLYLPRRSADELRDRIIEAEAARLALEHYGVPSGDSGKEARASMESRLRAAEEGRDGIVREILRAAKVLQGGGTEIFGDSLADKIRTGAAASLARLFPRFDDGDHRAWEAALKRARDGSDEPLKVVGWDGATDAHPVAKEVLASVGSGTRGSDLQKRLKAPPFGWPQDAVDAVLIALHRAGHLRAVRNGQGVAAGALDQAGVKSVEFRPEVVHLKAAERIALRGLFKDAGVATKSGEEEARAPAFLEAMLGMASRAGGDPPLPAVPDTGLLRDLERRTGTEQLAGVLEHKDELATGIESWTALAELAAERLPTWERARAFQRFAEGLPAPRETGPELEAIRERRSLLEGEDAVRPLCAKLAAALREALSRGHGDLAAALEEADAQLAEDATWRQLDGQVQTEIRQQVGLNPPVEPSVRTDADLRRTLEERPLPSWQAMVDAVPQRVAHALGEAARRLEPDRPTTTVAVRRGMLEDEAAVREWLAGHEKKLLAAVAKGPVIVC